MNTNKSKESGLLVSSEFVARQKALQQESDEGGNDMLPSITFPNLRGDVTITWTEENKEYMLKMIQKKMDDGYQFFVVVPRKIFGVQMPKVKTKLTNKTLQKYADKISAVTMVEEEGRPVGLNLEDSKVKRIVAGNERGEITVDVDDHDIEMGLENKRLTLARVKGRSMSRAIRRAERPEDVIDKQSVATRPIQGG